MEFRPCVAFYVGLVGLVPGTAQSAEPPLPPRAVAVVSATILKGLNLAATVRGTSVDRPRSPGQQFGIKVRSVDGEGQRVPNPHLGTRTLIVIDLF